MTLTPDEIRRIRSGLGLTQVELARKLQVTIDAVKSWETGRNPCAGPAEVLLRLLDGDKGAIKAGGGGGTN